LIIILKKKTKQSKANQRSSIQSSPKLTKANQSKALARFGLVSLGLD